jgi:hypothetical protein
MKKGISKYDGKFQLGEVFGNWVVTNQHAVFCKDRKEYCVKVKCKCDRQTERYVSCRKLKLGISWGCDCVRRKHNSCFWKGIGEIPGRYLNRIKHTAELKNIKMSVNKKYLWKLFLKQNRKCSLSGLDIGFGSSRNEDTTASLDRIDSNKGYIKGNVWWVHKNINIMKNDFSVEKFKELCKMVISYGN